MLRFALRPRSPRLVLALLLAAGCWGLTAPGRADDAPAVDEEALLDEAYTEALDTVLDVEADLVKAVEKVRQSSVSVLNLRKIPRGPREGELVMASVGSGVLVEQAGKTWVLTNVHVVQHSDALEIVTFDGQHHPMKVHDLIPTYDIALLTWVDKQPRGLKDVRVRASSSGSKISEGTWVIATGNPFFLANDGRSVTTLGVVSGTGRLLDGKFKYVNAVQHDAEVNPGNSGGPVWTLKGDLVGLNGMIMSTPSFPGARPTNMGASFALPAEQLDAFLRDLTSKSDAQSGYLGIEADTDTDDKGKSAGAKIRILAPDSPCAKGRDTLQTGDIIIRFGSGSGKRIYTATDLMQELSLLQAGDKIIIKYKRGNRTFTWKGELGIGR
ncbi:MAG: trypsin-like peptidase domain-containing protein [Planctomycetes bacterium]|nr:trypsin-like peptidase domain-containing protein [Planctomycetota bacterium]